MSDAVSVTPDPSTLTGGSSGGVNIGVCAYLTGLEPSTTYYVQYGFNDGDKTLKIDVFNFTTSSS